MDLRYMLISFRDCPITPSSSLESISIVSDNSPLEIFLTKQAILLKGMVTVRTKNQSAAAAIDKERANTRIMLITTFFAALLLASFIAARWILVLSFPLASCAVERS